MTIYVKALKAHAVESFSSQYCSLSCQNTCLLFLIPFNSAAYHFQLKFLLMKILTFQPADQLLKYRASSWFLYDYRNVGSIQRYIRVVLSTILHKAVLYFEAADEFLKCDHSNESYWAVLSLASHEVVCMEVVFYLFPSLWGGGKIRLPWRGYTFLWCCLLCCTRWFSFWVCGWNPKVWPFKWKLLSSTFLWCCLLYCTRWF